MFNDKKIRIFFLLYGLFGLSLFFVPVLIVSPAWFPEFDLSKTGPIGTTIGGTTGPIIAYGAAFITFLAFWVQYLSNLSQTKQFRKQDKSGRKDKFEGTFFEMLRTHQENTSLIRANVKGEATAFLTLFNEFRYCYHVLNNLLDDSSDQYVQSEELDLTEKEKINIAFLVFFWGIREHETVDTTESFSLLNRYPKNLLVSYLNKLYENRHGGGLVQVFVAADQPKISVPAPERRVAGHSSHLGTYYRHLYFLVKYLDQYDEKILSSVEKYHYAKIIRAQLTSYEQLLLYYNSLTNAGSAWLEEKLLFKYKILKNIPLPLAYFGIKPKEIFSEKDENGKYNFEWDELNRLYE